MDKSTHKVEVVPVKLTPHPNADTLSVVHVFEGYPCVVRTEEWQDGDLAAYIPPDSVVDVEREEFAWLKQGTKTKHRVRAIKLRGLVSYGLLVRAPEGAKEGDDVAEHFGVEHYEPSLRSQVTGGEATKAPGVLQVSKYDIDTLRRYPDAFEDGELVIVTEKIHGANSRYAYVDGQMYCGSRSEWKAQDERNLWWRALTPQMKAFCRENPGWILYGEVYGQVQDLKYGQEGVHFRAFDILRIDSFMDGMLLRETLRRFDIPQVPLIGVVSYDFEEICRYADGPSLVEGADHCREGCVVKPVKERLYRGSRLIYKVVGSDYLTR